MKAISRNISLSYIFVLFILYIYIFNPVFIFPGFGLNNVLLLVAGVYCIIKPNVFLYNIRQYRKELKLIIIMILYLLIVVSLSNTGYYEGIWALFGWLTTLLFLPIFIVNVILKPIKGIGFLNTVIIVGLIGAIISIQCLLLPGFNAIIRGIQTGVEMESVNDLGLSSVRSFGLGGNLTSAYGYMMGLLAALCILMTTESKKWYYLPFSFLFLIAALINARTGVFPFLLALLFVFIKTIKKLAIQNLFIFCIVAAFFIYFLSVIEMINLDLYDYLYAFIDFFYSSDNFEESSYRRMWFFPESFQGLLFGEGKNVFGVEDDLMSTIGMSSDIGFIRNIFLGGLFFVFLLILEQFVLYRNMYRRSGKDVFILILFISVLIFHLKGSLCYTTAAVSRFVMLYYFVLVHNVKDKNRISLYK